MRAKEKSGGFIAVESSLSFNKRRIMLYIGIDPGLDGAVAYLNDRDNSVILEDTPTLEVRSGKKRKREYNVSEMAHLLDVDTEDVIVVLEKIHSMPGQGVRSMFSMGEGYGLWKGIISAYHMPLELVTPQAWKKVMMDGMGKEKDASRLKAIQLFPLSASNLSRKKDHGRADALLIAAYYRRKTSF